jgi:hypothetical protein
MILTKNVLGYILGDFCSQTHLVTLPEIQFEPFLSTAQESN